MRRWQTDATSGAAGAGPASPTLSYLDLFENVQLIQPLRAWSTNPAKREINKPKSLVINSELARQ